MHVYVLPVVTAATVIGAAVAPECTPVFVTPPSLDVHVAVWLVIALPLLAPIVNVTVNEPVATVVEPDTAFTFVGAAGEPTITAGDAADARPAPRALVALTVHVYVFPVVAAVTVSGDEALVAVLVAPPSDDTHVAVKLVTALPLFEPGVNDTTSDAVAVVVEDDTAVTAVGGAGDPTITGADAADTTPAPRAFVALTVHV